MEKEVFCKLVKDFRYDPETGFVYGKRGARVGRVTNRGYRQIGVRIGKKTVFVSEHRAAWALHYKALPPPCLDHRNGDKQDNRINNLRSATSAENAANRKGTKGVYTRGSKFEAVCRGEYLGRFSTFAEARAKYEEAAKLEFKEFAAC